MVSAGELDRAARAGDPGLTEALRNAQTYGVAEYLAAGPKLLQAWEDARDSPGPHARGAALISAAIDIRRAGYTSAIPRAVLDAVHAYYLEDAEHARQPREPLANAWVWATRTAQATAALLDARTDDGPVEVFDYLVDTIQRREGSSSHVPESVVRAAIDAAEPADADSLAATAFTQGRYVIAEYGWLHAWQAQASNPELGPEHRRTLRSRGNHAMVLRELGKLKEAEAEHDAILKISAHVLGPRDPDTLTARANLAGSTGEAGNPGRARDLFAELLPDVERVIGPDHPEPFKLRTNLARWTGEAGNPGRARDLFAELLRDVERVLGPDQPATLKARASLAGWTGEKNPGRARDLFAELLPDVERVLGPDHPATLT